MKKCCICGSTKEVNVYFCMGYLCDALAYYCNLCSDKHIPEMRCPKHFLKAHREDVVRHSEGVGNAL